MTYPILMDVDQQYGGALHVIGLPTSIFVRLDGTISEVVDGELSYDQMVAHTERALLRVKR